MTDLITIRGTDGEEYRIPVAAMDAIVKREWRTCLAKLETHQERIEGLEAKRDSLERNLEHFKRDWLALLREIAKLYDAVEDLDESEAWQHADDATVWQEFDPWEALTVATATVKAGRDGAGGV